MAGHEFDRLVSLRCLICGYETAAVDLPIPTLDRAMLRAAFANSEMAPEWDARLQPQCPRCRRTRLVLDIGSLDRSPEDATV